MIKRLFLTLSLSLNLFAMSAHELQVVDKKILSCIKGVGEKRLNAILEYRKNNKISKLDDLLNIPRIGKKTIENIKNNIKKKSCLVDRKKQIKEELKREKKRVGAE
jgi:competence protein ComEA